MLKDIHRMATAEALDLLASAPHITLAGVDEDGLPILRTLHAVLHNGALCFHGSPRGEKLGLIGRPVVIGFSHTVARIPSYFRDAERACPATTYFESAQVSGVAELVEGSAEKARVLQALMAQLQPEGGHVRIESEHPLYRAALAKLSVVRVQPRRIVGKRKLGQERSPREIMRIVEGLWQRGAPGDLEAIERILCAHPARPVPEFLRAPDGLRLVAQPGERHVPAVVELLRDQYWNDRFTDADIALAHRHSVAWMVARDEDGRVLATARASSDDGKMAELFDVAVHPERRGRGVGRALLAALLDHPRLRAVRSVLLSTADAQSFYARHGFGPVQPRHSRMELSRDSAILPPTHSPGARESP